MVLGGGVVLLGGGESEEVTQDAKTPNRQVPVVAVVEEVPNTPPTANAGADQSVRIGRSVTITGVGEDLDEESELTFAWTISSMPSGSAQTLADSSSEKVSFTPDKVGTYALELVVSDGRDVAIDQVEIVVTRPPPPGEIRISLLPIGGADATLIASNGSRYACAKNPHCMVLEQTRLDPGEYTLSFTPRGQATANRKVSVRSGQRCIYNVSRDSSVIQAKCE